MNKVDALKKAFAESEPRDLAGKIVSDLNLPSPLIGAKGPPDQRGPEEPYIVAVENSGTSERSNLGEAIRDILLSESGEIARGRQVSRPLLLYNIFSLLEAVKLPKVVPALQALRDYVDPLGQALTEENDDLYAQLLIAHAVNQHASKQDVEFWLRLLEHDNVDYANGGIVGLRESGWEIAVTHLPRVREAHERHPELGPFGYEVMLLVDTYPTLNWPDCARDHVTDREIWELIVKHGTDRYVPTIDEMQGPAVEIIKRAGKQDQVRRRQENVIGSPAMALVAGFNGR